MCYSEWCEELPVFREEVIQDLPLLQTKPSVTAVGITGAGKCFGEGRLPGCSRRERDINSYFTFIFQCVPPRNFLLAGHISRAGDGNMLFFFFFRGGLRIQRKKIK